MLPRDVAWFYVRALRLAAAERDRVSTASAPRPRELKALLSLARGCEHVVEIGTGDGWTAAALALDDPLRHVTAYHPVAHPARDRYMGLAGSSVQARVDALTGSSPAAVVPPSGSACMLVIYGARGRDDVMSAFSGCLASLRTGGLVVFRGYGHPHQPGVGEAVLALGLDGRPGPGGTYVWRKPEPPPPPEAAPAPVRIPSPRRRLPVGRLLVPALVVAGVAGGAGLAALVTGGGSDSGGTTNAFETAGSGRTATQDGQRAGTATRAQRRVAAARDRERRAQARKRFRGATGGERGAKQPSNRSASRGVGGARGGSTGGRTRSRVVLDAGSSRHFSGTGRRRIGDMRLPHDSVLEWTSDSADLSIRSSALRLNSAQPRGRMNLSSGIYRDFTVESAGRWTITLRAP